MGREAFSTTQVSKVLDDDYENKDTKTGTYINTNVDYKIKDYQSGRKIDRNTDR